MSRSGVLPDCVLGRMEQFSGTSHDNTQTFPRCGSLSNSVLKSELSQDICVLLVLLKASSKEPALLNYFVREKKTSKRRNIDRVYKLSLDLTSFA